MDNVKITRCPPSPETPDLAFQEFQFDPRLGVRPEKAAPKIKSDRDMSNEAMKQRMKEAVVEAMKEDGIVGI